MYKAYMVTSEYQGLSIAMNGLEWLFVGYLGYFSVIYCFGGLLSMVMRVIHG